MKLTDGLFKVILESINDAVYFTDKNRCILYWNKAAENLTGFKSEEVVGKFCHDNILRHVDAEGNLLCLTGCPLSYAIRYDAPTKAKVFLHHKDGHRVPVVVKATPIKNMKGEIVGAAEVFFDNSYVENLHERIASLEDVALLDSLTQLSNRRYIEINLKSKILEISRYNRSYGLLFIDIDNFKDVNDTYGHNLGDMVLKMVAATLRNNVRYFDIVGRWAGDEFIIIVEIKSADNLKEIGHKILNLVRESYFLYEGQRIGVTVSIGAYVISPDDTVETAIENADKIMYKSKSRGKNFISFQDTL